eukprot:GAHX01003235.1.p1 GENE.GAHX01003235.1~~GAHX01003235.1.p1  ORF type:complete len:98 (+),score=2.02 GAHX01003235.1:128-421(+)
MSGLLANTFDIRILIKAYNTHPHEQNQHRSRFPIQRHFLKIVLHPPFRALSRNNHTNSNQITDYCFIVSWKHSSGCYLSLKCRSFVVENNFGPSTSL